MPFGLSVVVIAELQASYIEITILLLPLDELAWLAWLDEATITISLGIKEAPQENMQVNTTVLMRGDTG